MDKRKFTCSLRVNCKTVKQTKSSWRKVKEKKKINYQNLGFLSARVDRPSSGLDRPRTARYECARVLYACGRRGGRTSPRSTIATRLARIFPPPPVIFHMLKWTVGPRVQYPNLSAVSCTVFVVRKNKKFEKRDWDYGAPLSYYSVGFISAGLFRFGRGFPDRVYGGLYVDWY